ncbi:MAG: DUF1569 domain-containing protein [Flavobacteriaceae bacterium]|nr:DUF1569 domain-containing protein [Flavobacteriaceae bacterium]
MKSLLEEDGYKNIKERLALLTQNSEKQWGKMTHGQMVNHCQFPLKIAIKNEVTKPTFNPVAFFFKKMLYNDKPWRKGLPTAKQLRILEEKDFDEEKKKLEELIESFYNLKDRNEWNPHPMFGKFTKQQWGQMQYKHLDHHLRQFGV